MAKEASQAVNLVSRATWGSTGVGDMKITFDMDNTFHKNVLYQMLTTTLASKTTMLRHFKVKPNAFIHKTATPERHKEFQDYLEKEIAFLIQVLAESKAGEGVTLTC